MATARRFAVGSGRGRLSTLDDEKMPSQAGKCLGLPFASFLALRQGAPQWIIELYAQSGAMWPLRTLNSDVPCDRPPLGVAPLNGRAPSDGSEWALGRWAVTLEKASLQAPGRVPTKHHPPIDTMSCRSHPPRHRGTRQRENGNQAQAPGTKLRVPCLPDAHNTMPIPPRRDRHHGRSRLLVKGIHRAITAPVTRLPIPRSELS